MQLYRNASDNAAAEFQTDPRWRSPAEAGRQEAAQIAAEIASRNMGRDPIRDSQLRAAMSAARRLGDRGRYEPTEADLKAQRIASLQAEVRSYLADLGTIARIKMDCNPLFAPHGLHLVRLPNWGRA